MLKSQRPITEHQLTIQDAIERELKQIDNLLRSPEWSAFSESERQQRSLRARIAVMDRILEREEVIRHRPLFQSLTWQRQMYHNALTDLLAASEKVSLESVLSGDVVSSTFVPVSQEQIDEILNPPPMTRLLDHFKFLWEIIQDRDFFIELMEKEIDEVQYQPRSKEWRQLPEIQKQIRIIEEKIVVCNKVVAAGVYKRIPEVVRYALRAKECYTICLDALKMEQSSP